MAFMTHYKPNHRVIAKDLITGQPLPIGKNGDISDDVLSISTNKAYGRAAGTFQITMIYREWEGDGGYKVTYSDVIIPDTILTIELDPGDGTGFAPVMIGLVDRSSRVFNAAAIIPQRSIRISGQDAGKLLQKSDIGWDVSGVQVQIQKQGGGTGTEVIETIAKSYMKRTLLQTNTAAGMCNELFKMFRNSTPNRSIIMAFAASTDDDWMVWDASMQNIRDTSVWDAMKRAEHSPWNTLTTETNDINYFQVRLERTPIGDSGQLMTSVNHDIVDDMIVNEDLGYSDAERINLLCYWPTLYQQTVSSAQDIVLAHPDLTWFDKTSINTHGYCKHIIKDQFLPPAAKTVLNTVNEATYLQSALDRALTYWMWYKLNHELESGSMTLHLRPDIKCGHGTKVKQAGGAIMEYLIEQVSHQYSVTPSPNATTHLQLTRGQLA